MDKLTRMVSSLTIEEDSFLKTAPKDIGKLTSLIKTTKKKKSKKKKHASK